jgi:hypothetical protein
MDLVDDLLGGSILFVWEKTKLITEGGRQRSGRPQTWEWFEYLYNEKKKREQRLQQEGVNSG